jgi:hypothetical protein
MRKDHPMTGIVERLRTVAADYEMGWNTDVLEAADEIERLHVALSGVEKSLNAIRYQLTVIEDTLKQSYRIKL